MAEQKIQLQSIDGANNLYPKTLADNVIYDNAAETKETVKKKIDDLAAKTPDVMVGATADATGKAGTVPAPAAGDQGKFLRGDGTFADVPNPTKESLGLDKVDNTSDMDKPVSTATQKAINDAMKNASGNSSIAPPDMVLFTGSASKTSAKLKMQGPENVTIQTSTGATAILCQIGGFKVFRKTGGYPTGPDDTKATLVIDVPFSDNKKYAETPYEDTGLAETTTYYYAAYPYSDNGKYNTNPAKLELTTHDYTCYGYRINENVSVPSSMVTEIPDGEAKYILANKGYTPMHMDYSAGKMNWGSWKGDEFIFPRSCALKYDTTVDYYLNENDESKKEDGTASDYKNASYGGNMMVEFGKNGTIIWKKYKTTSVSGQYDVYLADQKLDDDFTAYAFMRSNGKFAKHFYLPKYFGYSTGGKLRSISGVSGTVNTTAATERSTAEANNISGDDSWGLITKSMWDLYVDILVLLGMSTDTQTVFGNGRCFSSDFSAISNGTMDGKGMFYGTNDQNSGVKALGVENPWGNIWKRIDGWNQGASGHTLIKLCKGTGDGSTANNFSDAGTGYIDINDVGQGVSGYISQMKYDKRGFRYPIACSGSETTYYADYKWTDTNTLALVGGGWGVRLDCGAFCVRLRHAASVSDSTFGSSPSCQSKEELST